MSSSTGNESAPDGAVDETRVPSTATPDQITIEVRPAEGLEDGANVTVTASGLDPGSAVSIDTCIVLTKGMIDDVPATGSAPIPFRLDLPNPDLPVDPGSDGN